MHKLKSSLLLFILISAIVTIPQAYSAQRGGQERKGRVEGTVINTSNEPIVGAKIQLWHKDSGQAFSLKSKKDGKFIQAYAPAGTYSVEVEKERYVKMTGEFRLSPNSVQRMKVLMITEEEAEEERINREAIEWYQKGTNLVKERRFDEALDAFHKAIELKPDFTDAQSNIEALLRQKGEQGALDWFEKGTGFLKEKKLEEALETFQKAVEIKPDFPEAYLNIGILFYLRQKNYEAEEALLKAHELNPEELRAKQLLAVINYESAMKLIESKKSHEALEKLEQAYSYDPDHAYVNYLLGILYVEKEMKKEAVKHLETFLRLEPNSPQAKKAKEILESLKK